MNILRRINQERSIILSHIISAEIDGRTKVPPLLRAKDTLHPNRSMANKEASLNEIKLKTVTELLGMNFYIPEYQRGYRWTQTNVNQLLADIWDYRQEAKNNHTFYCLQPVVVRKKQWLDINNQIVDGFELIDGQQRLTTIHRILTYLMLEFLKVESLKEDYKKELYHIWSGCC
jgi:uncharacterized protein with ParB-like and HNH nuclease domain